MITYTFEELWNSTDIQKIMNKACKKYRKKIDKDELTQIKRIAVWKGIEAIKKHKITIITAIYNNVQWECYYYIKQQRKHISIPYDLEEKSSKDDIKDWESPFLEKVFLHKYTLKEIGEQTGYSTQTICKKLNNKIERLRNAERTDS